MPSRVKNKGGLQVSENRDFSTLKKLPWTYALEQYKISALSPKETKGREPLVASPVAISQMSTEHAECGLSKLSCSASLKYTPDFEDLLPIKNSLTILYSLHVK